MAIDQVSSPIPMTLLHADFIGHGLVSLDKVMPLAPELDTAGLMSRDPRTLKLASKALYREKISASNAYPTSILAMDFPNDTSTEVNRLLREFLETFTSFLSATSADFQISKSWAADQSAMPPLREYVGNIYDVITATRQAELVRDPFYADYAGLHDGRLPFVDPSALARWAVASSASNALPEANAKREHFRDWLNTEILPPDNETCSKYLMVYVPRLPQPKYRNNYLAGVTPPAAFTSSRISVLGEIPDFVLPVGEVAYFSNVTNHTEFLPVSVNVMARKGCDGMLASLIGSLFEQGIVKASKTGRSMLSGEEILV